MDKFFISLLTLYIKRGEFNRVPRYFYILGFIKENKFYILYGIMRALIFFIVLMNKCIIAILLIILFYMK